MSGVISVKVSGPFSDVIRHRRLGLFCRMIEMGLAELGVTAPTFDLDEVKQFGSISDAVNEANRLFRRHRLARVRAWPLNENPNKFSINLMLIPDGWLWVEEKNEVPGMWL